MPESPTTPTGLAASAKIIVDAITTIFGAAVVTLFFFGLALIVLAAGASGLESSFRGEIIQLLIWVMVAILVCLVFLRIFKPSGLSGPLQPETEGVSVSNSEIE